MNFIITSTESLNHDRKIIGGKAHQLALISKFNIPNWIVITTDLFYLLLEEANQKHFFQEALKKITIDNYNDNYKEIISSINHIKFNEKLSNQISKHLDSTKSYAVRSSAIDEDGDQNSFAGILESYLYQNNMESICKSIIDCFKSCFSARALKYRLDKGISLENLAVAVIIQEMVNSEKSGVLFTANPTNGERSEFLISANYGLGEGVVSGDCICDEYAFNIQTKELIQNINQKDTFYTHIENKSGTRVIEISKELQKKSVLSEDEIGKLVEIGKKISTDRKFPQDIEWAIENDELYILQTRNITNLIPPLKSDDQNIVFDNSNIQESFCGITTPLTFSYANEAYFRVYHQMLSIMGLSQKVIQSHEKRHWNMISLIKGRVYYNINSWYEGLLIFPSLESNKDSMEKMMGLQDPVDFITDKKLNFKEKCQIFPTLFKCYANLIYYFINIDKIVNNFINIFAVEYKKFKREEFIFYDLAKLFNLTDQIIKKITSNWQAPIINDFYVMTFHGKAHRFLEKHNVPDFQIQLSNLLSGEEGIESTEPTKLMLHISDQIRLESTLVEFVKINDPISIQKNIEHHYPQILSLCQKYIELYGDRVMGELKLESISLRENPQFLYLCLKNYILQEMTLKKYTSNETELRLKTEKIVFDFLKSNHGSRKLKQFKSILLKTRKGVKYRENMRLLRTRVFGLSRDIYLEMGRQLKTYNALEHERDIFFLTLDELERYRMGRSVQSDLKSLVLIRKKEFDSYHLDVPANHFHTTGLVNLGNKFEYPYQENEQSDLSGLGCYPGIVEGEVVNMKSPDDMLDINGKILCTLRTDPGWAPIFPMIKGLIVERGSMLSHSAVIARELGIPTIVNIPKVTEKLATGDQIEMNGSTGKILKK